MRRLRWRDPVNENTAMAAIVIPDIPQLRKHVGCEPRAPSLAARTIGIQVGSLDQLTVGAPDHVEGGKLAEQLETNLVAYSTERAPHPPAVGDPAAQLLP